MRLSARFARRFASLAVAALLAPLAARSAPGASPTPAPTWGLWRYAPPEGQLTEGEGMRSWQTVSGRSFCQLGLYLAVAGGGDPRGDFVAEWEGIGRSRGSNPPWPEPSRTAAPNGWTRLEAEREETNAASGTFRVRQVTFSGHGRRMTAVALWNDGALFEARVRAFLASLVPLLPADAGRAAPAAPSRPAPDAAVPANAGAPPALTAQTWYKTIANYSHWGFNLSLPEVRKLSGQGYVRRTWRFGEDGRYRYRLEVWSMNDRPKELSGIEETGRWRRDGDRIVVEPERAVAFVEERQSRRRLGERPTKTGPTVYGVKMHYLSGMGAWYLVLAPVDGRPTDREGSFDDHPSFPGAYLYGPPPKVGA